jgi:hypothetical protein
MRVTPLALTLLICHQALALPATSVERSELQAYPISSIEVPYEIPTPQALDSRSPSHDKVTDLDTRSLQRRGLPWRSATLSGRISILLSAATATALQLANGWLTWQFNMVYEQSSNSWAGTIYSTNEQSASDLSVCVNGYTQQSAGNTGGLLWSEGKVDLEATWRSVPLGQSVTVFWSSTCRFYQTATIGTPIASTILKTIGNAWGYQLQYDDNWVCTTKVSDKPMLDILQTVFETCNEGQSS